MTSKELETLHLKCNPLSANKNFRAEVFGIMPNLLKLDGISKTEKDITTLE
jgi:hypothetical protein